MRNCGAIVKPKRTRGDLSRCARNQDHRDERKEQALVWLTKYQRKQLRHPKADMVPTCLEYLSGAGLHLVSLRRCAATNCSPRSPPAISLFSTRILRCLEARLRSWSRCIRFARWLLDSISVSRPNETGFYSGLLHNNSGNMVSIRFASMVD